ncbi:hypothetical protein [Caballeronia sp. LZ019]|uniref:hypothetical protein n=1 Tax=Caballeronia sp. LZ019 TaxID=3038555 RepID=UPI00285E9B2C|nr:hypothetical protein [Caballeronia sp. LZ019]MDR5809922.1 hypothetical protein [Caballeronia sp. LZ019]
MNSLSASISTGINSLSTGMNSLSASTSTGINSLSTGMNSLSASTSTSINSLSTGMDALAAAVQNVEAVDSPLFKADGIRTDLAGINEMSKLLIAVIVAAGLASACTTDTSMTYTARKLDIAGQQQSAYRVTCSGVFESQKSCMSKASQICKDRQVIAVQALDNPQLRPGGSSARQFDFACGG